MEALSVKTGKQLIHGRNLLAKSGINSKLQHLTLAVRESICVWVPHCTNLSLTAQSTQKLKQHNTFSRPG